MTKPSLPTPRGHVLVTHHFHDGERRESFVDRAHLGQLDDHPRRRHVSISWDEAPRLVLVAANPDSDRALEALQVLITFLKGMRDVTVAVDEGLAEKCEQDVAIVRVAEGGLQNGPLEVQGLLEGMDSLLLTESAMRGKKALPGFLEEREQAQRKVFQPEDVDLVMCLGGDGLILHVISHLFPATVPPFMPFNLGSMGFLTPFDFAHHARDVAAVLNGKNQSITMRMRLKCVIKRQPADFDPTRSPCVHNFEDNMLSDEILERSVREEYHVLNELVIDRGPAPYLSNLEVLCDDCPVTRVQADGLIVATPTGSTAYSLSSGGSMVHPSVPAILFTPICPHSLSFRPVLFPDYVTLQIKVPEDSRASAWVSFDGRHRMELMRGDKVVVSVSPWSVPTFSRTDTTNDWFASVSQCLRWNERVIQGSH